MNLPTVLFVSIILIAIIIVIVFWAAARTRAALRRKYPPVGQLVDVGGYRLHLDCQGEGSPTVILEGGAGAPGVYWALVQPEVAKITRVCAYDRAGFGWSEPSLKPRTAAMLVDELHTLLQKAGIAGPYVLVAHSLGGYISRQFAQKYPHKVVGMVLVDSNHEQQFQRFPQKVRDMAQMMFGRSAPLPLKLLMALVQAIQALKPASVPANNNLPRQAAETFEALQKANPNLMDRMKAEIAPLVRGEVQPLASLGDLPLVVLTHGIPQPAPNMPAEVNEAYEKSWQEMQAELARLSTNGKQIIATESGHDIHIDQPELVIAAIREVVAAARARLQPGDPTTASAVVDRLN